MKKIILILALLGGMQTYAMQQQENLLADILDTIIVDKQMMKDHIRLLVQNPQAIRDIANNDSYLIALNLCLMIQLNRDTDFIRNDLYNRYYTLIKNDYSDLKDYLQNNYPTDLWSRKLRGILTHEITGYLTAEMVAE